MNAKEFQKIIWGYYKTHGRIFPWRQTRDPYRIVVSEIMLQQTQTDRVIPKYREFIRRFPDFVTLARASLTNVLKIWQGLGYNRRALQLKALAHTVTKDFGGKLSQDEKKLATLPGIGPATAGAIRAFAFNLPAVFIETNIRSVFLHFFFKTRRRVTDREIAPWIRKTLPNRGNRTVREWYWALMDFGVRLKKEHGNRDGRRSAHYAKQSAFKGSMREARARVLRVAVAHQRLTLKKAAAASGLPARTVQKCLTALARENFLSTRNGSYFIKP